MNFMDQTLLQQNRHPHPPAAEVHASVGRETHHFDPALASAEFLERIQHEFAREHLILSQGVDENGRERLVATEATDPFAIHNTRVRLRRAVEVHRADPETIARAVDDAYARVAGRRNGEISDESVGGANEGGDRDVDRLIAEADRNLLSTQGKAPVVRLVDALLFEALGRGASDVHIQPLPDRTLVRYRVDGVLHTVRELSAGVTGAVVSRIKVMGRMDIAERRLPQDGRASVTIGDSERSGRAVDLRISTIPTSYGERAVIRLLDNTHQLCSLDRIGMPRHVMGPYLDCANRANGIILVTGPTGSGKTTTLYSTLRRIGSSETNIMTVEDPIEYELSSLASSRAPEQPGRELAISQSQVNPRKGITFAAGLRHILRQDPDVIMVGEIRDLETARLAIQSSLTGHLVFSTLHTNDAPSAVTRLIDLGIERYLVSASISAVLAQRLVRTVHDFCGGAGCEACLGTGYKGRTGLFELLVVDDPVRELISNGGTVSDLRAAAHRRGYRALAEEGARLVSQGRTTIEEVKRVVQGAA